MRTRAQVGVAAVVPAHGAAASVFRRLDSGSSGSTVMLSVHDGRTQFNLWLVIPLAVGGLIMAAVVWVALCYRRYRERRRSAEAAVEASCSILDLPSSEPDEPMETSFDVQETFRVPPRGHEWSAVLPSLVECPALADKRIPIQSLRFQSTLSSGACGEVWLGLFNGQQVAVKQLLRSTDHTLEEVKAFAEEIALSAGLSHPNVVSFVGVAWSRVDNLAMAMEYCHMGDLRRFLRDTGRLLTWSRDKIRMAVGIAHALRYIHERDPPIIHRDLKSKNVLLTETLEAKIIDFGVSRSRKDGFMTAGIGTPYWIAPEILEGKRYTEQADIYSFGVVLSELDTCKTPYSDVVTAEGKKPKAFQILHWVLDGALSPSFSDDGPRWIRSVGTQCLQHDPDQRPTAAELTQVLWADVRQRIYTL